MFEPVTFLAAFLTVWAQLNNYGIDTENPQLKNIRVRRNFESQLYDTHKDKTKDLRDNSVIMKSLFNDFEQNRIKRSYKNNYNGRDIDSQFYDTHNDKSKDSRDNSVIMKSLFNGFEQNRIKRSYKTNYNGNNNVQNNNYIEDSIPLASYPPNSPYYSPNTASVPYYYNTYNGNNNAYNINNNNGYSTLNNNGGISYESNTISLDRGPFHGQNSQNTHEKSGKYVMPTNSLTLFNGNNITGYNMLYQINHNYTQSGSRNNNGSLNSTFGSNTNQSNSKRFYNPFTGNPYWYNKTVNPLNNNGTSNMAFNFSNNNGNNSDSNTLHNGSNNTLHFGNNNVFHNRNNKTVKVQGAYIMGGLGCPEFMKSISIFGTKACIDDNYDYD